MFCFHKYGKVDEDNVQYCGKCGKARRVKCTNKTHIWKIIKLYDYGQTHLPTGVETHKGQVYDQACSNCGQIRRVYP